MGEETRRRWKKNTLKKLNQIGIITEEEYQENIKWESKGKGFWQGARGASITGKEVLEKMEDEGLFGWRAAEGAEEQEQREDYDHQKRGNTGLMR